MSKKRLVLFAGPCVIESMDVIEQIAKKIKDIADKEFVDLYFKASFDKANRTSISSYRGPGIDEGLDILNKIKQKYDVKIITDIHEPWQAQKVASVADVIQIPAFLCRQTDLLLAAGHTMKPILVKKGQFISPQEVINIVRKIESTGNKNIFICERGTSFGYNRLVVDMTGIYDMKQLGYPVVIDATHSNQLPGGNGDSSSGNSKYAEVIAKSAVAAGADALFFEVHPNPSKALSDGANMVSLDSFEEILERVIKVFNAVNE
ncbi:MAG: 3-deoxy-8-phosphooctulonate synthase [Eubacterium sp.]